MRLFFQFICIVVWASRVRAYPLEPTYPPDGQAEILPPLRSYPPRLEGETLPSYPPSQILPPTLRERESPGTPNPLTMVGRPEFDGVLFTSGRLTYPRLTRTLIHGRTSKLSVDLDYCI